MTLIGRGPCNYLGPTARTCDGSPLLGGIPFFTFLGGALPETPLSGIALELDAAALAKEGESPRLVSGFVGAENEGERIMRGILADDGETAFASQSSSEALERKRVRSPMPHACWA